MAANVVVSFLGDTKNLNTAFNQVQGQTTKTETAFGKLKRLGGPAMFGAAVAGVAVFKDALSGLRSEAEATRTLEATLKSMGRTEISTENIAKFASELQANSDFVEEEILAAAGVMATFGNIADKDLNRANQAAADLAARFNMDLGSATVMLGKALNDPIKGLTALGRAGVQFTDQQKEQIARMVEVGDVAGAQGLILEELGKQTTGAAAAQQDSFERLQDVLGETAETFVGKLMPAIEKTVGWITTAVTTFSEMDPAAQGVIFGITGITAALWLLYAHPIVAGLGAVIGILILLEERFGIVSGAVGLLGDAFDTLKGVAVTALQFIVDRFFAFAEGVLAAADSAFGWFGPWGEKLGEARRKVEIMRDGANAAFDGIRTNIANDRIIGLSNHIRNIPGVKIIDVEARTAGAQADVDRFLRGIPRNVQVAITADASGIVAHQPGVGRRAHGGPVSPHRAYWVGEEGPELLFMGPQPGSITSNDRISMGGPPMRSGGTNVNVFVAGSVVAERDLVETVRSGLDRGSRRGR